GFVPDEPAGGEAAEGKRLPPEDRRSALQRDSQVPDVAQERPDRRPPVTAAEGVRPQPDHRRYANISPASARPRTTAASAMAPVSPSAPIRTPEIPVGSCGVSTILTMIGFTSPSSDVERLERERRERAHGDDARALRQEGPRLLRPRGAGDVEVRPGQPAGELFQEHGGGDRSAGASSGVGEVGDLALQLL